MFSYLQTVAQPVRMEEYANVHLPLLTVSVPVGTQDPIAREQVATAHKYNKTAGGPGNILGLKHTLCFPICSL